MNRLISKAAESDNFYATGALNLQLGALTNLTVVVFISTVADQKTTACFIAVDFIMNSILTLKTIKESKRVDAANTDRFKKATDQLIATLIINESLEVLIPLTYMTAFAIAYFGPNSSNLGNIGVSYWHFQRVDDIWAYFNGAMQMALVDLFLSGFSFALIWKFTKMDVWKKCIEIVKTWGPTAAMYLPMILNSVSKHFDQKEKIMLIYKL